MSLLYKLINTQSKINLCDNIQECMRLIIY